MAKGMRSRNSVLGWLMALAAALVVALAGACGSSATGIDACRSIEEARCRIAPTCGIALTEPVSRDGREVDSCVRFYDDACKHGLASSADPSSDQVNACVNAINHGGCSVVSAPETSSACSFLVPVVIDSGTDTGEAEAGDGSTEGGDADSDASDN